MIKTYEDQAIDLLNNKPCYSNQIAAAHVLALLHLANVIKSLHPTEQK